MNCASEGFYQACDQFGIDIAFQSIPFFQMSHDDPRRASSEGPTKIIELVTYFQRLAEEPYSSQLSSGSRICTEEIIKSIISDGSLFHAAERSIYCNLSHGDMVMLYTRLMNRMIAFLDESDIEALIYGVHPHHPWDILFRKSARTLGIKQFFCSYYPFSGNRCYIYDDEGDLCSPSVSSSEAHKSTIDCLAKSVYKSLVLDCTPCPRSWKPANPLAKLLYASSSQKLEGSYYEDETNKCPLDHNGNALSSIDLGEMIAGKPTVIVFLHFEPECATNPLGKSFYEQRLAILALRDCLPASYYILLKDHPSYQSDQAMYRKYRGKRFLDSIRTIANVIYLPPDACSSAIELISLQNVELCITLTGTVSLLSLYLSKPVVILGINPIAGLPGTMTSITKDILESSSNCRADLLNIPFLNILTKLLMPTWGFNPYGGASEICLVEDIISNDEHAAQCISTLLECAG